MNIEKETLFYKDFFSLAFIFIICFLFGQLLSGGIIFAVYGQDALNFKKILSNPSDNLNSIRFAQIISSVITFGLPAVTFSILKKKHSFGYGLESKNNIQWLLVFITPLLVLTIYPFLNLVFVLNKESFLGQLMLEQQEQYQMFIVALLKPKSIFYFLFNFLLIAVLPAFLEEFFFRGTLQRLLTERLNIHLAILISSIIFSLIHFEFSAFLPRIVLGMLLGYAFYWSGSIWVAIFIHLFNNGLEVTLMYLKNLHLISGKLTDAPQMPTHTELVGYSILFIILSILFYRFSKR
ncbi:MAG TPA: CPBP family intramembrane metalloprotease [Chitinophagales bacterium]|nr:CPBP family intramembrane metalloprotease [Chitinophagales bacterium]